MPIELNNLNMIDKHELIRDRLSLIKLIVMDLDGTVLDNKDDYAEEIIELSKICLDLSKLDIFSMVATGRTLNGSIHIIDKLIGETSIPIITYNGSLVIHNENKLTLDQKFISLNSLKGIISICKEYIDLKTLFYYFEDNIISYKEYVIGWTKGNRTKTEFNKQIVEWVDCISDLIVDNKLPSAILIDISNSFNKEYIINNIKQVKDISVTSSGNKYIEIRPKDSDKGHAIQVVSKHLNLNRNEILAIGDNDNDVELLTYSGVGVCISDASKAAKESSDFITSSGAFEGVLEVLRLVKEINRLKGMCSDV
jgi:Cof subfamily protein (haloacid dehalogenase superfamily)